MNAPDFLTRLRQKNAEKNTPSPNCINPVKDFTQFVQFAPSAKKDDFSEVEKIGTSDPATAFRWLVHYVDREPLICTFLPEATHAEILEWYPDAVAAEPFTPTIRQPSASLTDEEETAVRTWLALIEETDPATIAEVIGQCQRDAEARDYFTGRAAAELPKPDPFLDDRRTCDQCANLIARSCQAAKRGEMVASRNYEPIRGQPRRCEGYVPGADDPDRRPGRERWPGLMTRQAPDEPDT